MGHNPQGTRSWMPGLVLFNFSHFAEGSCLLLAAESSNHIQRAVLPMGFLCLPWDFSVLPWKHISSACKIWWYRHYEYTRLHSAGLILQPWGFQNTLEHPCSCRLTSLLPHVLLGMKEQSPRSFDLLILVHLVNKWTIILIVVMTKFILLQRGKHKAFNFKAVWQDHFDVCIFRSVTQASKVPNGEKNV